MGPLVPCPKLADEFTIAQVCYFVLKGLLPGLTIYRQTCCQVLSTRARQRSGSSPPVSASAAGIFLFG